MPTRKLIEVALPLDAISNASAREKTIHTGHPANLHTWWSRKPLAVSRAIIFASLISDPFQEDLPVDFLREVDQLPSPSVPGWNDLSEGERRRYRLFQFIETLVKWESNNDSVILDTAYRLIFTATGGSPPIFHDPFAGGGSIPLEAQRLGLNAYASDLNPVAVLINKAMIEIPPKFAGMPPVNPVDRSASSAAWKGSAGLVADVRYYGRWMRDEAERLIGHLYPKAKLPKEYGVGEGTVIAWIWARTVSCSNPACGGQMPLVNKFWLSTHKGNEAWAEPIININTKRVHFVIHAQGTPPSGTVTRSGAKCLICGHVVSFEHIRQQGIEGKMSHQLMAVAVEGKKKRVYLALDDMQSMSPPIAMPEWIPDTDLPVKALGFRVQKYGITKHSDLFTNRQLVALDLFCELLDTVRCDIISKQLATTEYADAVVTYLAFSIDRLAQTNNTLVRWLVRKTGTSKGTPSFDRQIVSMVWEFSEGNVFAESVGSWSAAVKNVLTAFGSFPAFGKAGIVLQQDATHFGGDSIFPLVSTDPPYFDNIGYADLSDFYFVWMRRSLGKLYPSLFSTVLTPKRQELIAASHLFDGDANAAEKHFMKGLEKAFASIKERANHNYPLTVYYAFKQSEEDSEDEEDAALASTGWETMLEGLIRAGFAVNGTWPVRTEQQSRMRAVESNALATSIVLVCCPRPEDARSTTRLEFVRALRRELPAALRALQSANIAPVDLAQAAIGPGMAIYSRHKAVLDADGTPMRVRAALQLINQALDEVLAEQEGAYDADTRWAIAWFEQFAFEEGAYGVAETLSKAKNTSVQGMVDAGVALARAGKVRLLRRNELPEGWLPTTDGRLTAWEMTQHLVWALDQGGELAAAVLLQAAPSLADAARDLAYRLYSTCERKKWAAEALAYNSLVIAWPEIARLAVERGEGGMPEQRGLFE